MAGRKASVKGLKRHRDYSVDEAARALKVAKGTVRRWLKGDLPAVKDQKPALILGGDLVAFLNDRRATKQPCQLHECFCFTCRAPRAAAGNMADLIPLTPNTGNLRALCGTCTGLMHKRFSLARLPELRAILEVTIRQADTHIVECVKPSPNDHFPMKGKTDA